MKISLKKYSLIITILKLNCYTFYYFFNRVPFFKKATFTAVFFIKQAIVLLSKLIINCQFDAADLKKLPFLLIFKGNSKTPTCLLY